MGRRLQDIFLIEMFLYIICGWLIIGLWQRFIENFFYNGLGLDRELPYHNFIVMFIITSVFLFIISFVTELHDENIYNENDSINSYDKSKNNSPLNNTNGVSTTGQNYKSNFDGGKEKPIRKFHAVVDSFANNSIRQRGFPTTAKNNNNGHNRIRKRQKDMVEDCLHRVDQVLSNWSSRDR